MLIGGKRDGCSFTGGQYNTSAGRAKYATWYSHDIAHGMERREAVGRTTDGREGSPDTRVVGDMWTLWTEEGESNERPVGDVDPAERNHFR